MSEINNVFAKSDPQLLMIFKTKYLLRNIELSLGTHNNKTSMVEYFKKCTEVVRAEELQDCQTYWSYIMTSLKHLKDNLMLWWSN